MLGLGFIFIYYCSVDVPAFKEGEGINLDKVKPNEVTMSWKAPEDDGNCPITGYEIEKSIAGTDKWQKVSMAWKKHHND